jgi:hypothetical protein
MSTSLPQSTEALVDLVIQQTQAGDIDAAKRTASQITDWNYLRRVWMSILYKQFFDLNDLQGVKETVLSLTDHRLWMGVWVHDLVLRTAESGDIDGARTFIKIMPKDSARGHLTLKIVSVQAKQGDYTGAEATLAILLKPDNPWYDMALLFIVRGMVDGGDIAQTEAILTKILDPQVKARALDLCTTPPVTSQLDTQK